MRWETKVNLAAAAVISALVWLATSAQPDLLPRVLIAAALMLISRDVIDAALEGTGQRRGLARVMSARFAVFAWLSMAQFAALYAIFVWTGPVIELRTVMIGAVVGLVVVSFQVASAGAVADRPSRFNLDRPADATRLGRLAFYGWPFAATAIVVGGILFPPEGGLQGVYPLFQMVFLPFLVPLYMLKAGWRDGLAEHLHRLAGYVLLVIALAAA